MADKYRIEEWELPDGTTEFRVHERIGRWPFRKWVLSADNLPSEAVALKYIRDELMTEPRLVRCRWFGADMSEDSGW